MCFILPAYPFSPTCTSNCENSILFIPSLTISDPELTGLYFRLTDFQSIQTLNNLKLSIYFMSSIVLLKAHISPVALGCIEHMSINNLLNCCQFEDISFSLLGHNAESFGVS